MGSGFLGTNIGAGRGFFGFDPTPQGSLTNTVRGVSGPAPGSAGGSYGGNTAPVQGSVRPSAPASSPRPTANDYDGQVQGANTSPTYRDANGRAYSSQAEASAANEELAYIDEQMGLLRGLLSRSKVGLDQGLANIGDEYNRNYSRGNEDYDTAKTRYNEQEQTSLQGQTRALGQVDTNARTLANSVRQRLARASGSGSSAYQITAPGAINRDASQNREVVQETFGENFNQLKNAREGTDREFGRYFEDLGREKNNAERGLREGIATQEQGVLGQLADLARQRAAAGGAGYASIRAAGSPYQQQYNQRTQQMDSLFNQFRNPYANVKGAQVQNANLSDYITKRGQVGTGGRQQAAQDIYRNPFNRDEEEQRLI